MRILYGSVGGTTRRVAQRLQAAVGATGSAWSAKALLDDAGGFAPDDLIVCGPTYGDGELDAELERALVTHPWRAWAGRRVAFCEVGIYTGYEDFGHGLLPIFRHVFGAAGLVEAFPPLSLDSAPLDDGGRVEAWGRALADAWVHGRG